ncbi:MAG: DNA polymerase III subunit delta' [Candidatus Erginobacter occultus]|nr:DNA polymerase III subunit delta' [Candidatus Erginobacter occultus]
MLWDSVKGQSGPVVFLQGAIAKDRVVSGYLFSGPEGVGKSLTASVFAAALNCRDKPGEGCGECPDCRAIVRGGHPDVHRLSPSSKSRSILAGEIRDMRRTAHLSARGDNWKVFLIEEADRMNTAAQNIFLKTLEEPPPKTVLILITSQPGFLLPTIHSRCQRVAFSGWPYTLMEPFLQERLGIPAGESFVLHSISGGCPGRAIRSYREGIFKTRREVIGPLAEGRSFTAREAVDLAERWLDISARPGKKLAAELKKEAAERDRDLDSQVRKEVEARDNALVSAADQAGLDLIFQLIFSWIRDLFLCSTIGSQAPLINRDLESRVADSARRFTTSQLRRMPGRVEESRVLAVRAASRPARRIILENMLIELGFWRPGNRT